MKELFFTLADHAFAGLQGSEVLLLNFSGEVTDFVRFNHGQVRQPMTVRQAQLGLTLIDGMRRNEVTLALAGTPLQDRGTVTAAVQSLRAELPQLPEDPYLLYSTEATRSERVDAGALPCAAPGSVPTSLRSDRLASVEYRRYGSSGRSGSSSRSDCSDTGRTCRS